MAKIKRFGRHISMHQVCMYKCIFLFLCDNGTVCRCNKIRIPIFGMDNGTVICPECLLYDERVFQSNLLSSILERQILLCPNNGNTAEVRDQSRM